MNKSCEQYRKQIELYESGLLEDKQEVAWLMEHLQDCPECAARLASLEQQDRNLDDWVESLESIIAAGQEQSIQAFRAMDSPVPNANKGGFLKPVRTHWMRYAAAAAILIIAGFLAGRLSTPSVDQERVVSAVLDQLRPDLAQGFAQLKEDVSADMTDQFQTYARETLAASNYQTNQQLQELIDAIAKAQVQERQWVYSALDQIERNRIQDQYQMRQGLAAFAALTGDELEKTQQKIDSLAGSDANP